MLNSRQSIAVFAFLIGWCARGASCQQSVDSKGTSVKVITPLSKLDLPDVSGRLWHGSTTSGKVTVVLYVCGCDQCRLMGSCWAKALPAPSSGKSSAKQEPQFVTVVIFEGSLDQARGYMRDTSLERNGATLVIERNDAGGTAIGATTCPTIAVMSKDGSKTYLANAPVSGKLSPPRAAANALAAVRKCILKPDQATPTDGNTR